MKTALWVSLAAFFYVYVGYPLLLSLLVRLRGAKPIRRRDITPRVTLIISAFNEAGVIRQKLENALALDYPADALEIVVCSDASTDATDAIVRGFAPRGVVLRRQPVRRGKTAGLNDAVPLATGDIVIFSDANSMYEPDAVHKLVRNFADPEVGCVTGEARYEQDGDTTADAGERAYWDYEIRLKRLESARGSMVGGDGAIYAIRKSLWWNLPETAINDFMNPLQIVAAGHRAVYEPEAVCHERTAGGIWRECTRRVRIVSRSWRAVFGTPRVLNPFAVGFFALSVISHKVLRWLSLLFLVVVAFALLRLAITSTEYTTELIAFLLVLGSVYIAVPAGRRYGAFAFYFIIINIASLVGVIKGTRGRVSATWSTGREPLPADALLPETPPRPSLLLRAAILLSGAVLVAFLLARPFASLATIFWLSAAVLGYVYVGYPSGLAMLRSILRQRVRRADIEPRVCVFIAANDEADVIEAKLHNSLELEYPKHLLRVVVASDGSVDATNAIVRSFADRGVRLIEFAERRGKISAINAGMRTVEDEIVVFTDANVFIRPDALRLLVRNFGDNRVGAVSGDVILVGDRADLGEPEDLYYRYERWLQGAESDMGSMIGVDGALYAIRRRLFVPPPDDTILDDMAIPMAIVRSGYRVVYEPAAVAFEQGSRSAREEFARKARIVAGAVQFLRRARTLLRRDNPQVAFALFSHKVLRWLSPIFAVLAFGACLALAPVSRLYFSMAALQAAMLLCGLTGCVPRLRRVPLIGLAHYFLVVHSAAAVGFMRGLLRRQSTTWRRFARAPIGLR